MTGRLRAGAQFRRWKKTFSQPKGIALGVLMAILLGIWIVSVVVSTTAGVRYVRGAAPVEEATPDRLVRYSNGKWATWVPGPGPFPIAPQTCVAKPLAAGQRTASICSLASLFPNTGMTGQQWFAVGDTISVDLRGLQTFTTRVVALTATSLTFADAAPRAGIGGH